MLRAYIKDIITSVQNEKVKDTVVRRQRKNPDHMDTVFVEGKRATVTALTSSALPQRVFVTSDFLDNTGNLTTVRELSKRGAEIYEVTVPVMNKLSDTESPQGIASVFKISQERNLFNIVPAVDSVFIVLDGVKEPGNVGTIIRTAEGFGVSGVIVLPGTADPFSSKAVRAAAGCVFNINVYKTNMDEFLKWISNTSLKLITTVVRGGVPLFEAALTPPLALVLGQEAEGVSTTLLDKSTVMAMIPLPGKAESINVSISAAICLYEMVRQKTL